MERQQRQPVINMLAPVQLFGRWWWWCIFIMIVTFIKQDHWSQGLALLPNNCQLKLGKVHQVNRISVISGVRVLLKCLPEIVWKSPGNFLVGFIDTLCYVNYSLLHLLLFAGMAGGKRISEYFKVSENKIHCVCCFIYVMWIIVCLIIILCFVSD